jgi:protocatechuate 3,4-dioxygenase beta subunit
MKTGESDRRLFLKQASLAALSLPLVNLGLTNCTKPARSASIAPSDVPWRISTVAASELGEPLIVSGTIYAPDGQTPLEGINLYVYQTDATGNYSTTGGDHRLTRIHGLMRSNAQGRYEFQTIKPAPYPRRRDPAHIHAYVSGSGYPEYWIDSYLFADDPFITDEQRKKDAVLGSFASILTLERGADGILRGSRNIRVERCSNNCTGRIGP